MRVIVCGGRGIGQVDPCLTRKSSSLELTRASAERKFIMDYLSRLHSETPLTLLITAEEGVIASICMNWAAMNKVATMPWRRLKFPKSSINNFITSLVKKKQPTDYVMESFEARNARMIADSHAEMVLAFGGGNTTRLLVKAAIEKGFDVVEVEIPHFENMTQGSREPTKSATAAKSQVCDTGTLGSTPTIVEVDDAISKPIAKLSESLESSTSPLHTLNNAWKKSTKN